MADIQFFCPHCAHGLIVTDKAIGLELPCPACAKNIKVPVVRRGTQRMSVPANQEVGDEASALVMDLRTLREAMDRASDRFSELERSLPGRRDGLDALVQQCVRLRETVEGLGGSLSARIDRPHSSTVPLIAHGPPAESANTSALKQDIWRFIWIACIALVVIGTVLTHYLPRLTAPVVPPVPEKIPVDTFVIAPATSTHSLLSIDWLTSNLPRKTGYDAVLRIRVKNNSTSREVLLRHALENTRLTDAEGRAVSHHLAAAHAVEHIPAGQVWEAVLYVESRASRGKLTLVWLPGLWMANDAGVKTLLFAHPLTVDVLRV